MAIQRGLEKGRSAAFFLGVGAVMADLVIICTAFLGTTPLIHHPLFHGALKWIGVVVLLTLGAKILMQAPPSGVTVKKKNKVDHAKNSLLGFLLVISNPALFVMWVGITGFLLGRFPDLLKLKWFFLLGFFIGGSSWFGILSLSLVNHARSWKDHHVALVSKIIGVFLIALGIFLIFEKVH